MRTGAPPASHHLGDGIARADISVDFDTLSCSPSSLPLVVRDLVPVLKASRGLGGERWGGDVRGPTVDMEIAAVWWARGTRVQGFRVQGLGLDFRFQSFEYRFRV